MGLSSEERYVYFTQAMTRWRYRLAGLRQTIQQEHLQHNVKIVNSWIGKLDTITGIAVKSLESNTGLWLFGRNEDDLCDILSQPYRIGESGPKQESAENLVLEGKEGSYLWYQNNTGYLNLVTYLSGGDYVDAPHLRIIAAWWDQWMCIAPLLYPVYRYRDGCFPKPARRILVRLMGEIVNRRFELCSPYEGYGGYADNEDYGSLEIALLARAKVFSIQLEEKISALWSKKQQPGKLQFEDFHNFVKSIGKYTLPECDGIIQAAYAAKQNRRYKANPKEEAERAKKFNGILGPPLRSREELERVLKTTKDLAEAEKADKELAEGYHSHWSGWRDRFETKKKTKKKK